MSSPSSTAAIEPSETEAREAVRELMRRADAANLERLAVELNLRAPLQRARLPVSRRLPAALARF